MGNGGNSGDANMQRFELPSEHVGAGTSIESREVILKKTYWVTRVINCGRIHTSIPSLFPSFRRAYDNYDEYKGIDGPKDMHSALNSNLELVRYG